MLKYHLNLVRIWYQNPSIFHTNSIQKTPGKPASFFVTIFVSKIFQNLMKTRSKMLCRNCATPPWGHFGQIKPGSWSQGHLQGPSSCSFWRHMDLIWSQFSSCSTCSHIISRAVSRLSALHNCIKKTRCQVKTEPLIIHHPHLTAYGTFV